MLLNADGSVVADNSYVYPDGSMFVGNENAQDQMSGGMRWQPGISQPYIEDRPDHPYRGRQCVRLQQGLKYNNATKAYEPRFREFTTDFLRRHKQVNAAVWNTTSLPRMVWVKMKRDAVEVYRQPLVYWAAIRAQSVTDGVDPYRSMTYEYEAISDPGEAFEDMDVVSDGRKDSPVSKIRSQPIPIQYMPWHLSDRLLRVNENNGRPYTSMMNRFAARRIAELVEDGALGNRTGITFGTRSGDSAVAHDGTSTLYGARTLSTRLTSTSVTLPTTVAAFNPETHYNEMLALIQTMRTNNFYGPYTLTYGGDWWPFLAKTFSVSGGNTGTRTLLQMLEDIPDVRSVLVAPRLTATYQGFVTQAGEQTVSAFDAFGPTLVQWDEMGGARRNFRTMACQGTFWHFDYNGVAAHLHFTAA